VGLHDSVTVLHAPAQAYLKARNEMKGEP
jgi:hypothetical protein